MAWTELITRAPAGEYWSSKTIERELVGPLQQHGMVSYVGRDVPGGLCTFRVEDAANADAVQAELEGRGFVVRLREEHTDV